jgi:hypothetical protein
LRRRPFPRLARQHWRAIRSFDLDAIAPGSGDALAGTETINKALSNATRISSSRPSFRQRGWPKRRIAEGCLGCLPRGMCDPKFRTFAIYEHCLPFNVARAYDEAMDIDTPRIWTAERDARCGMRCRGDCKDGI